jgi:hypothetical protein
MGPREARSAVEQLAHRVQRPLAQAEGTLAQFLRGGWSRGGHAVVTRWLRGGHAVATPWLGYVGAAHTCESSRCPVVAQ